MSSTRRRSPRRSLSLGLLGLLVPLGSILSCGLLPSSKDDDAPGDPCASTTLSNTVAASPWATRVAGIASYRYSADRERGETTVELLDADGGVLDTMRAWQSFGADDAEEGAMVAELGGLRLTTRGLDLDDAGYLVRARLTGEGKPTLIVDARFAAGRCYPARAEDSAAPPCAGALALEAAGVTLPSCGLINDQWALADRPATLARLDYAVPASEVKAPPAGGIARTGIARTRGDGDLYLLSVYGRGAASDDARGAWLAETGLDAVVGSDAEVRLTTAFLDRSWWREVEKHVGYCQTMASATASEELGDQQQGIAVVRQAQCAGDTSSSDWDGGDSDSGGSRRNVWGDPHLVTLDGLAYDFQAAGEFVLLETTTGAPLRIHARFEPFANPAIPACTNVTYATAIATEVDGHGIAVHVRPAAVYVDGEAVERLRDLPELTGGSVRLDGNRVAITWPGGERMTLSRGNYMGVSLRLPDSRRGQTAGLLGDFNGDSSDDHRLRDGEPLATPLSFETKYPAYAQSWRLEPGESLLHYREGESGETFTDYAIPGQPVGLDDLPAAARAEAEARCAEEQIGDPRALASCILDVACATEGDDELAEAAAAAAPSAAGARPGDDGLVAGDDALSVAPLPSVEGTRPAEPTDVCQAPAQRFLRAFPERSQTLAAEVSVDLAGPGGFTDPAELPGGAVPAGATVRSWLVHRDPDSAGATPLEGWLRFKDRILGVIVGGAKLGATDEALGAAETKYPTATSARGLEEGDAVVIEPDGKTLRLRLGGEDLDHVRVLTEEVSR